MKELTCENVLMAMMAGGDGESAPLSSDEIKAHLTSCADCCEEVVRMQQVNELFQQVTRRESTVDLWPAINRRLVQQSPRIGWQAYAFAGVLLLGYKLIEMLPEADPGWAIKLAPLIIFGVLLLVLRENPFKINTELVLEK
jgi:predicted anti-sigma-YlaC factor YlaD